MSLEFGLIDLWVRSDWMIRSTAILLFVMSVVSWTVVLVKCWQHWQFRQTKKEMIAQLQSKDFDLWDAQTSKTTPWECIRLLAIQAKEKNLISSKDTQWYMEIAESESNRLVQHLNQGLVFLSSIAATAPFVGLFGTVIGIYQTMIGLSSLAGMPTIADVAAPVGETLIMTALGLLVAIPAVIAYNLLLKASRNASHGLLRWAMEMKTAILSDELLSGFEERLD